MTRTRREHIEGELDFIDLNSLIEHIEEPICDVIDIAFADEEIAGYLKTVNPGFQKPARPFLAHQ